MGSEQSSLEGVCEIKKENPSDVLRQGPSVVWAARVSEPFSYPAQR